MARKPDVCGVYEIRNTINGRRYIGSSYRVHHRWKEHKRHLRRKMHHSFLLQRAWDKYEPSDFIFSILEVVDGPENLVATEQYWFDELRPYEKQNGYNLSPFAGSESGIFPKAIGSRHGMTSLTEDDVAVIKKRLAFGETLNDIAIDYGVSFQSISTIKNGDVWTHVPDPVLTEEELAAATRRRGRTRCLRSPKRKLTEADVVEIRKRAAHGESGLRIAADYPVCFGTVYGIIAGRTWKHTPGPIAPINRPLCAKLTVKEVQIIRDRLARGESCSVIAKDYQVAYSTIAAIKHGKTWAHVPSPYPAAIKQKHKKLTESNVREIKQRLLNGERAVDISRDYPVSAQAIYGIKQGRTWTHVD